MFGQQRLQNPPRRAARAQQQNPPPRQCITLIATQVAHQPRTIGVVAAHAARLEEQGIDRPGPFGAGAEKIGEHPGVLLERHGDVQTPAASVLERLRRRRELARLDQQGAVFERLAGLGREQGVNPG